MTTTTYRTAGLAAEVTEALVASADARLAEAGHPSDLVVRDTLLRGFVVRLRQTGRHVYCVQWARGRMLKLGTSDTLTAGQARKAARAALAQATLEGAPKRDTQKRERRALTLRAFLAEHYEPWCSAHIRQPAETVARLRVVFADFLDRPLADLSPFDVERWRSARLRSTIRQSTPKARRGAKRAPAKGKTVSPATVNRDLTALRAALSKAVLWNLLKAHPLAKVKPSKVDTRGVVRYLEPEEETRLREALAERDAELRDGRVSANQWRTERGYEPLPTLGTYADHLSPLVLLAINTGLRRGEAFALRWADVDLGRASLVVRGETAKSKLSRHVPLNSEAVSVLTAWRPEPAPAPEALVFPSPVDRKAPLTDVKTAWRQLMTRARLKAFRFHDCRHHFASRLVMSGTDLNTVRELLGHSTLDMTLRYAHLAPQVKAAAVERLVSAS